MYRTAREEPRKIRTTSNTCEKGDDQKQENVMTGSQDKINTNRVETHNCIKSSTSGSLLLRCNGL